MKWQLARLVLGVGRVLADKGLHLGRWQRPQRQPREARPVRRLGLLDAPTLRRRDRALSLGCREVGARERQLRLGLGQLARRDGPHRVLGDGQATRREGLAESHGLRNGDVQRGQRRDRIGNHQRIRVGAVRVALLRVRRDRNRENVHLVSRGVATV